MDFIVVLMLCVLQGNAGKNALNSLFNFIFIFRFYLIVNCMCLIITLLVVRLSLLQYSTSRHSTLFSIT